MTVNSKLIDLVNRAQNNDENALESLIDMTQKDLLRFCYHLTNHKQAADDLCQSTFIKALENIKKLKEPQAFKSWLFQMAKNQYYDFLKSSKSKEVSYEAEKDQRTVSDDFSFQVKNALQKLSPDERFILLLVDMEGASYQETAQI